MAWPSSVATNSDLYLVANLKKTTLNGAINNSVTTITLTSTSGLPTKGILLLVTPGADPTTGELVLYTGISGNDITGVTRGFGGTAAATHANLDSALLVDAAEHHNALKDEVIAVENSLATGTSGQVLTSNGAGVPATFQAASSASGWTDDGTVVRLTTSTDKVGIGTSSPDSSLQVSGSVGYTSTAVSSNTTLTSAHFTVRVDASGGSVTITLPAASGCTGRVYNIKKSDSSANAVVIDGDASETIDGALTVSFTVQYQSYTIQSNGTSWDVL